MLGRRQYPNRWMPERKVRPVPVRKCSVLGCESRRRWSAPGTFSASPSVGTRAGAPSDRTAAEPRAPGDPRPMIPLGQFRDTFIIAVDDEGMAIIDQHVAHERVLFERVMERLSAGPLESQRLLVPMVMELSPVGAAGAGRAVPRSSSDWGSRSSGFGDGDGQGDRRAGAARRPRTARGRCSRSPRISRGWIAAPRCRMRCSGLPRPPPAMPR